MPQPLTVPADVLATLPPRTRRLLRWAAAMQTGRSARWWHRWRRAVGARAVLSALGEPPRVAGWDYVQGADRRRPLLLLANHRSYVDFFVVAAVLLRRLPEIDGVNFPVKGSYCYEGWPGALLNALGAGFAAFPPFFRRGDTSAVDTWSLDVLIRLCSDTGARVIGFHPEGTRHQSGGPWDLLPAQPGVGRLLLESNAQALPVFIAGLENSWAAQRASRAKGTPVRVRFGAPIDLAPFADAPRRLRTYVGVGAHVMARLADLAAADRAEFGPPTSP